MNTTPMRDLPDIQRQAFLADGFPTAQTRIDRIDRVKDIHVRYKQQIVEAPAGALQPGKPDPAAYGERKMRMIDYMT